MYYNTHVCLSSKWSGKEWGEKTKLSLLETSISYLNK